MPLPDPILAPIQAALDSLVAARLRSRDQAKELDDKVIQVTITGLDLSIYVCAEGERLVLRNAHDGTPDAAIAGSIPAFLRALAKPGAMLPDDIAAEGDTSLVRDLRDLLSGLEFDWEDRLSKFTGDPLAHGVGDLLRRGGRAVGYAGDRLLKDVAEYLREETRDVVSKTEAAGFAAGVDRVRDEVERFAARMAQVESAKPSVKP